MRRRACFYGLFSALATIGGSGVGGMTAGVSIADVVVLADSFSGLKRFKFDSCGFLCLIELSSKICAACG